MTLVPASSHGGPPTGAAGGDLSGTYPNPTVAATLTRLKLGFAVPITLEGVTMASFAAKIPASPSSSDINGCVTSIPVPLSAGGAGGLVFSGPVTALEGIPDDQDAFAITAHLAVGNTAGTQILIVRCALTSPAHTTTATLNWSTATTSAFAGADLVWDGVAKTVTSTAGGVFAAMLMAHCEWD